MITLIDFYQTMRIYDASNATVNQIADFCKTHGGYLHWNDGNALIIV